MRINLQPPRNSAGTAKTFRAGRHSLDLARAPFVMGVVNVTPDSFSDGGLFLDPAKAEEQALRLEAEGADIIDLGGESSRPGALPVSADEECSRVIPALRRIVSALKIPVSVDTCKFEVMEQALDAGASIINDIRALQSDARIPGLVSRYGAGVILMHMRGDPSGMQDDVFYPDVVSEVEKELRRYVEAALTAGIPPDRIAVDPGIGFGKSPEANVLLLSAVPRLKRNLGFPVCVGLSRKSFLKRLLGGSADLKAANAAAHALAAALGAGILRVHDVSDARTAVALAKQVLKGADHASA